MKFHRIIALLLVIAPVLSVSCKKDEEEEVGEYLSGSIDLVFPSYVTSGYTKQFRIDTMSTLYRGDKLHKVGYYFTNPTTGKSDTVVFDGGVANPDFPDGVYTFTAPDKLDRYSISVTGYSKDYYVKSASVSFVVVDPRLDGKGSITGFELEDDSPLFVDPRDSRRYYTTTVEVDTSGVEQIYPGMQAATTPGTRPVPPALRAGGCLPTRNGWIWLPPTEELPRLIPTTSPVPPPHLWRTSSSTARRCGNTGRT